MHKHQFISLEGLDGAGKTTVVEGLRKFLEDRNVEHIMTKSPGGPRVGKGVKALKKIREMILDDEINLDKRTEMLMFALDRRIHLLEIVLPALREDKMVISDRDWDSTVAYQAVGKENGEKLLNRINDFMLEDIADVKPSLVIFFDINPNETEQRLITRQNEENEPLNKVERLGKSFQWKVYDGYKMMILSEGARFSIVDATQSKEKVLKKVISIFKQRILKEKEVD